MIIQKIYHSFRKADMSTHYYPALRNCGSAASLAGSIGNGGGLQEGNSSSSLNNRMSTTFSPYGEVQQAGQLIEQIAGLYLNDECSDLVLIVEGQRFPVHRVILGTRSAYFKAMLYGGMRESTAQEVTLEDTPVNAFTVLLKYIYTGKLQLKSLELGLVLDMLALVHKYGFTELEAAIPDYLKAILKNGNVCSIFTVAHLYSLDGLVTACLDFIDNCASELISTQSFLQLPAPAFILILGRNSFCAPELEIFSAVRNWIEAHPDESQHFPTVLAQIRLPLLKDSELYGPPIRDSGLFTPDQILDAIRDQKTKRSSELNYRGFLFPGTNVATPLFAAKVTTGDMKAALLMVNKNGAEDAHADPIDRSYSKHLISPRDPGITIELGRPFILNNIRLHLLDRDQRTYSYFIEVSVDSKDWVRIIDHTRYVCRSRQNLLFDERVVKYIRVVGTHCSVSNSFQLSRFEAIYTMEPYEIDVGTTLQIPRTNVATIANNALVVEGVSRSRNALLNGDTKNYDWDDGYTCHQLGSGALVVQLPQPYLIETMRLLLWDCDARCYSFYLEVSVDQNKWAKVAEVNECRSWQTVHFDRQPVVFVRIVGTQNSANEVFHCVHFECPAMESDAVSEEERLARLRRIVTHTIDGAPSQQLPASENLPLTSRATAVMLYADKEQLIDTERKMVDAVVEGIVAEIAVDGGRRRGLEGHSINVEELAEDEGVEALLVEEHLATPESFDSGADATPRNRSDSDLSGSDTADDSAEERELYRA